MPYKSILMRKTTHSYDLNFCIPSRDKRRKVASRRDKQSFSKRQYREAYELAQKITTDGFDETEKF